MDFRHSHCGLLELPAILIYIGKRTATAGARRLLEGNTGENPGLSRNGVAEFSAEPEYLRGED